MIITKDAKKVTDGTTPVIIAAKESSTKKTILYGFGNDAPTEWYSYRDSDVAPLIIGTDFGAVWLRATGKDLDLVVTMGVQ